MFMDEDGNIIENGATIVRTVVESFDEVSDVIYSGISVLNLGGSTTDFIKMNYVIDRIDNGIYQICFPTTCNMQTEAAVYETGIGQIMGDMQDIQSEWFPVADGECVVTLTIEIFTKMGFFPPTYVHKGWGPTLTLRFVKSSSGAYIQLADGVFMEGTTLYITSDATSLGDLRVNPTEIFCYATIPPVCMFNTFTGYGATLHVPATSFAAYFVAPYWCNFGQIVGDAVEPLGVALNKESSDLLVNDQLHLTAAVTPTNATPNTVTWSTNDATVATVDNGLVTVVGQGECDIIASCLNKKAMCHITAGVIEVSSITLSQEEAFLEVNEQVSLTATVTPDNATYGTVNWLTSNSAVAVVDANGMVRAVGTGECDIIATCGEKQAVCHVIVVPQKIYITLDKHTAKVLPNHMITLIPSVTPVSTDLKVTSSDPTVAAARILNGVVQVVGISEGTAAITVGSVDGYAIADTCQVTVYTEIGDVNCDGFVNISDVTDLIDYLLSGNGSSVSQANADCDKDCIINIADVTTLIDFLLSGWWPWNHDPNDYIDLGLPSGTLWATCNVGANCREEYGDYFAWGETEPKEIYSWETYKWCNGTSSTLTKYCTNSTYGMVDNKTELDPEDDAAYMNWGPMWRMPTKEQQQELYSQCSWIQARSYNGNGYVYGYLVTGPNGNSLFLPAGGYRIMSILSDTGSHGSFWSRALDSNREACILYFNSTNYKDNHFGNGSRHYGRSVRAVRASQN